MLMSPENDHSEIKALILENQRLLAENNVLLKKMHKSAVRHFWLNIIWIIVFLGLPLIAFYKLVMPMYDSLGASPESLSEQLQGIKELQSFLEEQR